MKTVQSEHADVMDLMFSKPDAYNTSLMLCIGEAHPVFALARLSIDAQWAQSGGSYERRDISG